MLVSVMLIAYSILVLTHSSQKTIDEAEASIILSVLSKLWTWLIKFWITHTIYFRSICAKIYCVRIARITNLTVIPATTLF